MLALCPPLFLGARRLSRSWAVPWRTVAVFLTLSALVLFLTVLWDGVFLGNVLPVDDVLAFGQWTPQLTALLLAFAWPGLSKATWRRYALAVTAGVIAVVTATTPLWTPVPLVVDVEQDGCVLQTSAASCGAGATANLLRLHGIDATESEMVALCRTGVKGTWYHGLVRGLRIKTRGTPWRVRCGRATAAELAAGRFRDPVLLSLYLSAETAAKDPRYAGRWGWVVGQRHVVVLVRMDGDKPYMADSATGYEHWGRQALDDLFVGRVIWLERRP